ncbi:MAG: TlyA family RNA methyltransferase [Actinobacteria bacterium]|nr:TlyA family RNA methyltransferase [Actinomycetota bacterium]
MRIRLDTYLYERGLFESRAKASAAVLEGLVLVDGRSTVKPGTQVTGGEEIEVLNPAKAFVSRGGIKLERALDVFKVDVSGRSALDVGSSTGGFTECLLNRGAARVISLDAGKGQLHLKLRQEPRVTVLEGFNARYLKPEDLPFVPSLATVDVSFISLRKVIEPAMDVLADEEIVALVKPQFEAGRRSVSKGGVVRDPDVHVEVLNGLLSWLEERDLVLCGVVASPIKGPKGNIEYFFHIKRQAESSVDEGHIAAEVRRANEELA